MRQELMDLGMESWVELQCHDRENVRRELPATRAEPRNLKEFSVICATGLYDHLIVFCWPARACAGALDESGIAVLFKAETSALWIAQQVNDLPSESPMCGVHVHRACRYPYVAIHFRCFVS